jgi:DNA adenine methylase
MNSPLKWPGGKHYVARQLVEIMPSHTHYVEPYAGSLAVLLAKPSEGISEVVNDLHGDLTTFWRVLQSPSLFCRFRRRVEAIPFSETEWQDAQQALTKPPATSPRSAVQVDRAVRFFVLCRQSLAGRCKNFGPISRTRTRRGMNEQAAAWLHCIDGLPEVYARLQRVVILNRPAVEVIRSQDGPETLFYLDPPYHPDTRASVGQSGACEMTAADHEELLDLVLRIQGKVLLSGYACPLYDSRLSSWQRREFDLPNHQAGGVIKRRMTEVLWSNFKLVRRDSKEVA